MKTKVFLIRHGETEWNKLGKFQGCTDIELADEGIKQAQYVANKFADDFDLIYTSPLKRAMTTAEIISKNKQTEPIVLNGIREIGFGEWEGLTVKEIANNFPDEFKIWRNDKLEAPLCGGDLSIRNASDRAKLAITDVVSENKGKKLLIVAHGGIIKAALIGIFNWDMTMYHKISLGNTSISQITFDNNLNPSIVTINDTSHLPKDYSINSYV